MEKAIIYLKEFDELRSKIERSLHQMDANISFLLDGAKGFYESYIGFQDQMTDFMSFKAEGPSDHE